MSYPLTIVEQIDIGKVSTYLSMNDVARQNFVTPQPFFVQELPLIIAMETDSVEWQYDLDPTDTTLFQSGNWLYALCGRYALEAQAALNPGGTVVNFINNGNTVSIEWVKAQFVIGDPTNSIPAGATDPNAGDTSISFPYGIMPNSELITYNGVPVPIYPDNDFWFSASYSTNSTTYSFRDGFDAFAALNFQFAKIL